jgi:hypothetical protein
MSDSDRDAGPDGEDGWKFDPDAGEEGGSEDPPETPGDPPEEADGWRFELDDVDEEGIIRSSIEPGRIDRENAVFVLLGVVAMVLVFVRLWTVVA